MEDLQDEDELLPKPDNHKEASSSAPKSSEAEAFLYLVRGNLGPGCLNLPFAFAQTGWLLGSGLMVFVAGQGIYCMWLLTHCKHVLKHQRSSTFMDIAAFALGDTGKRFVQFFLIIVQGGCCCVYVQLISTNLESAVQSAGFSSFGHTTSLWVTTLVILPLSMLRNIAEMKAISLFGNLFMLTAVLTVMIYAGMTLTESGSNPSDQTNSNSTSHHTTGAMVVPGVGPNGVAICLSSLFFAYEGMGLVLPVENSMAAPAKFPTVLVTSMTTLGVLFVLVNECNAFVPKALNT
jgi:proton-coupled amino acid transporter